MNKIVFFTVIYPSVKKYLDDFFSSLERQTIKVFDVVVVNDGVEGFDFYKYNLNISVVDGNGTIAKIREEGFNYLLDKDYEYIIFGDSDDYFDDKRIEHVAGLLAEFDIVVNDFTLVDKKNHIISAGYLSKRLTNRQIIDYEFIKNRNIFGLSNTAIRKSSLRRVTFSDNLVAVDWCFFSNLLIRGCTAVFSSEVITYYRQHEANTAGFQEVTSSKALGGIFCKSLHFCALSSVLPDCQQIGAQFSGLYEKLKRDNGLLKKYTEAIKLNHIEYPLWWEQFFFPEDFYEDQIDKKKRNF